MIWKVLRTNIKVSQLIAAFVGVLCGLSLLMGAVLFYSDIRQIFEDKEGFWKDEYIVINKDIHFSDSFKQVLDSEKGKAVFSAEEIENLKNQSFISDVATFTAATFSISVFTDRDSPLAGFYSDIFFEAVPDDYIDVNTEDWFWEEGMLFVPTILPRAYLNLYNFGFAQSQGLPQISEDGAGILDFNVVIYGQGERAEFKTSIVGFSDRLNTFLVPLSFINWGNKQFGHTEYPEPGRLIIIAPDPSNIEMLEFFEDNEYVVSKSLLSNSKALAFLKITTGIVLTIGIIIITLAFWLMIVSLLLLLERNYDNISKLSLLGYTLNEIAKPYTLLIIILLYAMYFCSYIPLLIFRSVYSDVLVSIGYQVSLSGLGIIALPVFALVSVLCAALILFVRKEIRSIMS